MATERIIQSIKCGSAIGGGLTDTSNSLYMHPLDSRCISLVPVSFNRDKYRSLRRSILQALLGKTKLGFVNGECKEQNQISANFDYGNDVMIW